MNAHPSTRSESHVVAFTTPAGTVNGTFTLSTTPDGLCQLSLVLGDQHVDSTATDYFDALSTIRRALEPRGILPVCYGASLTCFPSGMARDMAAGLTVYKLNMAQAGRRPDLVALFDTGPDVVPSTVDEQRAHYAAWLRSIGASPSAWSHLVARVRGLFARR